eukprot:scaffold59082_cov53-Cyclotella_meneghiniana.AAC.1
MEDDIKAKSTIRIVEDALANLMVDCRGTLCYISVALCEFSTTVPLFIVTHHFRPLADADAKFNPPKMLKNVPPLHLPSPKSKYASFIRHINFRFISAEQFSHGRPTMKRMHNHSLALLHVMFVLRLPSTVAIEPLSRVVQHYSNSNLILNRAHNRLHKEARWIGKNRCAFISGFNGRSKCSSEVRYIPKKVVLRHYFSTSTLKSSSGNENTIMQDDTIFALSSGGGGASIGSGATAVAVI